MTKKIKKYVLKREIRHFLKKLKKHAVMIVLILLPLIALIVLGCIKKKAKKKIKKAVRAKVREGIDNRFHKNEDEEDRDYARDDEQQ